MIDTLPMWARWALVLASVLLIAGGAVLGGLWEQARAASRQQRTLALVDREVRRVG